MKTGLEKYIEKNRPQLDVEEPDDLLIWEGIRSEIGKKSWKPRPGYWKIAAVIILAFTSGFFLHHQYTKYKSPQTITLSGISNTLAKEEAQYQLVIRRQFEQIDQFQIDRIEYQDYFRELSLLDELNTEYLHDLQELQDNPRIIEALLKYYEHKIRILEKLLNEIEKRNSHENKNEPERYHL